MTPLSEAIILGSPTTPVALGIPPVPLLAVRRATGLERWEGVSPRAQTKISDGCC